MRPPAPLSDPTLRDDLPCYPPLIQLVRITAATVPGPSGWTSASIQSALLYVASTQQLRTDTLFPRDREPCLALDVNGWGITPGYYLGRLAGSWQSLPVYECGFPPAYIAGLFQAGFTPSQVAIILANLNISQLGSLGNLNPCQLQALVTAGASSSLPVNVPMLQNLTSNLSPTQLGNLVGTLTSPQIAQIVGVLTVTQLQQLTTALTGPQIANLIAAVPTPQQLAPIVGSATPTQLQSLMEYPPATVAALAGQPLNTLLTLLNKTPLPPSPILGNQGAPPYIPAIVGTPSSVPTTLQGYAALMTDQSGNLYVALPGSGSWGKVAVGGGGTTSVFIGAGASHASGLVPDPGSTAHNNDAYVLKDNATFGVASGWDITLSAVTTSEGTVANIPADLATVQSIAWTQDGALGAYGIQVNAVAVPNGAGAQTGKLYVTVDGTAHQVSEVTLTTAGSEYQMSGMFLASALGAGAHTIKLQFACAVGGNVNFSYRAMRVYRQS